MGGGTLVGSASSWRKLVLLVVVAGVAFAILEASASARLDGPLERGKDAVLLFNKRGVPSGAKFLGWRAPCSEKGTFLKSGTIINRFDRRSKHAFHHRGAYTFHDGKYKIHTRLASRGHQSSRYHWDGRFRATSEVSVHGHHVTTCKLGSVHWFASKRAGSLKMQSAEGDYIGGGRNYVYLAPGHHKAIGASGNRQTLTGGMGGWTIELAAGAKQRLKAGRTYSHALRYPFNDRHPGLTISGHGRGCNENFGTFKILRLRFTGNLLTVLKVKFVQHCEGPSAPPLRGTFTYFR